MRKALVAALLLVLGSAVLGATVLREPLAWAAKPIETVIVGNNASQPVPVQVQGTANVKLDPTQNTVQLGGQPIHVQAAAEQRFSVIAQAFSSTDMTANCVDLTTLPPGTLLIESIDIHAFFGEMTTFLSVPARSTQAEAFGIPARIPVPLASYPGDTDAAAHTSTAVVVREGLAAAGPGELTRDDTHPVRMCVRDHTESSAVNSLWTVSGRVVG
jgi:hypothetical protein